MPTARRSGAGSYADMAPVRERHDEGDFSRGPQSIEGPASREMRPKGNSLAAKFFLGVPALLVLMYIVSSAAPKGAWPDTHPRRHSSNDGTDGSKAEYADADIRANRKPDEDDDAEADEKDEKLEKKADDDGDGEEIRIRMADDQPKEEAARSKAEDVAATRPASSAQGQRVGSVPAPEVGSIHSENRAGGGGAAPHAEGSQGAAAPSGASPYSGVEDQTPQLLPASASPRSAPLGSQHSVAAVYSGAEELPTRKPDGTSAPQSSVNGLPTRPTVASAAAAPAGDPQLDAASASNAGEVHPGAVHSEWLAGRGDGPSAWAAAQAASAQPYSGAEELPTRAPVLAASAAAEESQARPSAAAAATTTGGSSPQPASAGGSDLGVVHPGAVHSEWLAGRGGGAAAWASSQAQSASSVEELPAQRPEAVSAQPYSDAEELPTRAPAPTASPTVGEAQTRPTKDTADLAPGGAGPQPAAAGGMELGVVHLGDVRSERPASDSSGRVGEAAAEAQVPVYTVIKRGGYPSASCSKQRSELRGPAVESAAACAIAAKREGAVVFSLYAHARTPGCFVYRDLTGPCSAGHWESSSTDTTYMLGLAVAAAEGASAVEDSVPALGSAADGAERTGTVHSGSAESSQAIGAMRAEPSSVAAMQQAAQPGADGAQDVGAVVALGVGVVGAIAGSTDSAGAVRAEGAGDGAGSSGLTASSIALLGGYVGAEELPSKPLSGTGAGASPQSQMASQQQVSPVLPQTVAPAATDVTAGATSSVEAARPQSLGAIHSEQPVGEVHGAGPPSGAGANAPVLPSIGDAAVSPLAPLGAIHAQQPAGEMRGESSPSGVGAAGGDISPQLAAPVGAVQPQQATGGVLDQASPSSESRSVSGNDAPAEVPPSGGSQDDYDPSGGLGEPGGGRATGAAGAVNAEGPNMFSLRGR